MIANVGGAKGLSELPAGERNPSSRCGSGTNQAEAGGLVISCSADVGGAGKGLGELPAGGARMNRPTLKMGESFWSLKCGVQWNHVEAPFMVGEWGATTREQNREDCNGPKRTISQHEAMGCYNWYQSGTPLVGVVRGQTRRKLMGLADVGGAGWGATTRGLNREDCDGQEQTISQHE
ncbi:hypothetical protein ACLOJK_022953, partial [Asimina triloba]